MEINKKTWRMELDLMEWKNVEINTEQSIRAANVTIALETIMLKHAKEEIKKLGGKTSEEEKAINIKEMEKVKKVKVNNPLAGRS